MSKTGMSAMQILASFTTAPGARWSESTQRGRLSTGMDADIVVLETDPSIDARNFAKVRYSIRAGKPIYSNF